MSMAQKASRTDFFNVNHRSSSIFRLFETASSILYFELNTNFFKCKLNFGTVNVSGLLVQCISQKGLLNTLLCRRVRLQLKHYELK